MGLRRGGASIAVVLIVAACGNGAMTLSEYAGAAEGLVAEMEASFAALDGEWEGQAPTVAGAERYWEGRLAIRDEFLDGVQELRPPEQVADQHRAAVAVFEKITAADAALADAVAGMATIDEHWQWVDTPEGRAAAAVLEEVYEFCRSSQDEYDATRARESLDDLPWVPAEMAEVVKVAFGCPPADAGD